MIQCRSLKLSLADLALNKHREQIYWVRNCHTVSLRVVLGQYTWVRTVYVTVLGFMLGWLLTISDLSDSFHSGYCWGNSRRILLGSGVWGCFGWGAAMCETRQSALQQRHVLSWAVVREVVNMLRCSRHNRAWSAWSCESVLAHTGLAQGKWVSLGIFQKARPSAWARLCTCRLPDHL